MCLCNELPETPIAFTSDQPVILKVLIHQQMFIAVTCRQVFGQYDPVPIINVGNSSFDSLYPPL